MLAQVYAETAIETLRMEQARAEENGQHIYLAGMRHELKLAATKLGLVTEGGKHDGIVITGTHAIGYDQLTLLTCRERGPCPEHDHTWHSIYFNPDLEGIAAELYDHLRGCRVKEQKALQAVSDLLGSDLDLAHTSRLGNEKDVED